MKKAVLIIAALVVFTGFTFAQAAVGAWGRGLFIPAMGADGDTTSAVMTSWGPGGVRVGVTISGTSDNVGFQLDFNGDNGKINAGDQQKIWVKPISMLTVQIGKIYDDTLRGNAVFGAWDWLRFGDMDGEDAIFWRVGKAAQVNAEISLAPVEGAYIFVAFGGNYGPNLMAFDPTGPYLFEDVLKLGQYGGGYTIAGIGQIRLQYLGVSVIEDHEVSLINAAFKLTMIEGLVVDLGGFIPIASEEADVDYMTATIALFASYKMDALTVYGYGDVTMFGEDHAGDDLAFSIGAGADYNLEGGIAVNADIRYNNDIEAGNDDGTVSLLIGAKMGFSNGLIGIGLEITTGYFADWTGLLLDKTEPDAMAWALPIRLEYWF